MSNPASLRTMVMDWPHFFRLLVCFFSLRSFSMAASTSAFGTRARPRMARANSGIPEKSGLDPAVLAVLGFMSSL
jgi:hypothetical protein